MTEFLRENVRRTFDEDKEMLEAQQRIIGRETDPMFQVAIKADAGPQAARVHDRERGAGEYGLKACARAWPRPAIATAIRYETA